MSAEAIERVDDIDLAYDAALLENQGYDLTEQLGIRDMASMTIEAHDRRYSVAAAIAECPPFAAMVQAVAESVPEEMRATVVRGTVMKMADQAPQSVPDAVRAQDNPAEHRAYLKKN